MAGRDRPENDNEVHNEDKKAACLFEDFERKIENARCRNNNIYDVLDNLKQISASDEGPKREDRLREAYEDLERTTAHQLYLLKGMLSEIERENKADFVNSLRSCDNRSDLMDLLSTRARNLPLYCRTGHEVYPPPSVGAIPVPDTVRLEVEDFAACYDGDTWAIAEVVEKLSRKQYRVHDIDTAPNNTFVTDRKLLTPLPKWKADPEHDPYAVFPVTAIVLAVFPRTTVLYRGIVVELPSNSDEDYKIRFTNESGCPSVHPVPQHHVVRNKDVSKFKKEGGKNKKKK